MHKHTHTAYIIFFSLKNNFKKVSSRGLKSKGKPNSGKEVKTKRGKIEKLQNDIICKLVSQPPKES